jgi:hypothetical protein
MYTTCFLTHYILLVVDETVYATIVLRSLATREIFRTLALLRSASFNLHLTRGETACAIQSNKLLFFTYCLIIKKNVVQYEHILKCLVNYY